MFEILPDSKGTSYKCPKFYNIAPKWWNFAKSGHTAKDQMHYLSSKQWPMRCCHQTNEWPVANILKHSTDVNYDGSKIVYITTLESYLLS